LPENALEQVSPMLKHFPSREEATSEAVDCTKCFESNERDCQPDRFPFRENDARFDLAGFRA
jgi:hypothetical protein